MAAFDQAQTDLAAMQASITAGDAAFAVDLQGSQASLSGSYYADATKLYQAAGQQGATVVGPAIDAAGAPNTTQTYTQAAYAFNAPLAAIPLSGRTNVDSRSDAQSASAYARKMVDLYTQAIIAGQAALAAPAPPAAAPIPGDTPSSPAPVPTTVAVASSALAWKSILVAYGMLHPGAGSPQALQFALAQAMGEGSLTGYFRGTNNFGAMHATQSFAVKHANDPGYGMVAFLDHAPAAYISRMAVFPSMALGARSYLHLLELDLGASFSTIASVSDYSAALYVHGYYGGFHTPRTPLSQRAAALAAGTLTAADQANISDYASLISNRLPAVQEAMAAAQGVTSDPTLPSSGGFAPLADRLTPGPKYAPHTLEHAQELLGAAATNPPPGAVSLADCLAADGGQGAWLFAPTAQVPTIRPGPAAPAAPATASSSSASSGAKVVAVIAVAAAAATGALYYGKREAA